MKYYDRRIWTNRTLRERETVTDGQTDRQTDRDRDRERQREREREKETDRQTNRARKRDERTREIPFNQVFYPHLPSRSCSLGVSSP